MTDGSNSGLKVTKQNWYVYNADPKWDATYFTGTRIYGKKQIYLYTIHLNRPPSVRYVERYTIDEKHKTPAFLDHLAGLGQLFGIAPGGGAEKAPAQVDMWYAFRLDVKYVPADIQITPVMVIQSGTAQGNANPQPQTANPRQPPASPTPLGPAPTEVQPGGQPPSPPPPTTPRANPAATAGGNPGTAAPPQQPVNPGASPAAGTASGNTVTLDAKTFDNEGKYRIDFSVGVPVTKISELSYVQTTQGIAPAKVDKQKIFALFDFYPFPVDIKNTVLPKFPYLLTGVALGSQPLKKALFGVGWGPIYANFYAAMLLNTQQAPATWKCGDKLPTSTTGMKLNNHSCPEFNFGLNVAVGAIADALKSKSTSSSASSSGSSGGKK